jgi:hypothetical protein
MPAWKQVEYSSHQTSRRRCIQEDITREEIVIVRLTPCSTSQALRIKAYGWMDV